MSILGQLAPRDRLGIVKFESNAEITQQMESMNDLDINKLEKIVIVISFRGGTNSQCGYKKLLISCL